MQRPVCHPDKVHQGRGLCRTCYHKEYRKTEKYKQSRAIYDSVARKLYRKTPAQRKKEAAYNRKKRRENIQYRIKNNLRRRLWKALRGQKIASAVRDLGCSIEELKFYLEKQFKPGMTWENNTHDGWHMDHIIPLSAFDLTKREEVLKACHYTNLQPLWAIENFKKSNKY